MASWEFPPIDEENNAHKTRLLNVEEKPFKRITRRLVALNHLIRTTARQQATPPPESIAEHAATSPMDQEKLQQELQHLKDELMMDFSAFDSNIARLQFLLEANERERERYAADKVRIINEAQEVKDSAGELRVQLEEAKAKLAQRRKFDELADRITSSKMLKPRDEQHANIKKLEEECRELECESESYAGTWRERRDQFSRIVEEGMQLRRLIRDERDEVDRREGMEEGEEEGETGTHGGQTPKHLGSGNESPRPDSTLPSREGGTPRPLSAGRRTPRGQSPAGESLKPLPGRLGSFSRGASQATSRETTPNEDADGAVDDGEIEEGEDVEMDDRERAESGEAEENPRITIDSPRGRGEKMDMT